MCDVIIYMMDTYVRMYWILTVGLVHVPLVIPGVGKCGDTNSTLSFASSLHRFFRAIADVLRSQVTLRY